MGATVVQASVSTSDVPRVETESETAEPAVESSIVQLPTDVERSPNLGYRPALHSVKDFPPLTLTSESEALHRLLTTITVFLHRYSAQREVGFDLFGFDTGPGRRGAPIGLTVDPAASVAETTAAVVAALGRGRGLRRRDGATNIAVTCAPTAGAPIELARANQSYDLHFLFVGPQQSAPLIIAYNANLLEAETVARWSASFVELFRAVEAGPKTSVGRLPIMTEKERSQVVAALDGGRAPLEAQPVHVRFAELARSQPEAIAAHFQGRTMTYRVLEERSRRLAAHLAQRGVAVGTPVGVCVEPSFDVLVAIMAIFRAGGIYLPLDPTHPPALVEMILEEVRPALVLTQSHLSEITRPGCFPQLCFDRDEEDLPDAPPAWSAEEELTHASHLIYTSGTTGRPKGVLANHQNLAFYLAAARNMYGFGPSDAFVSLARYTFSISLWELLSPLCCGGSLRLLQREDVLAMDRLEETLREITVLHAGPSLLTNLFRHLRSVPSEPRRLSNLRHASSGGDIVSPQVMAEMKAVFDQAELFVIYGCTEISCMGCTFPIEGDTISSSFVGRPFPNVSVQILDANGEAVPLGVVGEIFFAGEGVTQRYLHRPELTAERFVERDGRRYYQTGDLGRLHANGYVEILGRQDFQVQVRGVRIELLGIESNVREMGLASQCAVVAKRLDETDVRLVAYLVKPNTCDPSAVRKALSTRLPEYMIPQHVVVLDAMPLTHNGKLDRRALEALPWRSEAHPNVAPRSTIERQIASAFAVALEREEVGIDDDFFELGGHSLLAVLLLDDLENTLGLSISPGALFEHGTVRALAEHAKSSFSTEPKPISLNRDDGEPPIFMLAGVHLYRALAKELEGHFAVYGVYVGSELLMFDDSAKEPSVPELARSYLEVIRRRQPSGPYRIAGMSFGGLVAYEAAQQLRDAGETVVFVGLLDSVLPDVGWRKHARRAQRLLSQRPSGVAKTLSDTLAGRMRTAMGRQRAHAQFTRDDSSDVVASIEDVRQASYLRAARNYAQRVRPYSDPIMLVTSARRLAQAPMESPTCGWTRLAPELRVLSVDADHLALVEPPKVEEVAAFFLEDLRRTS